MKYSNYIGSITAVILISFCFLPWAYIDTIHATITGMRAEHTNFGRPGLLHICFSVLSIVFFLVPAVWAKRTNLFIGAFNFAWSIRNYLVITQCEVGECPHKQLGIFSIVFFSGLLLVMTTVPDI